MKKIRIICVISIFIGIMMISVGITLQSKETVNTNKDSKIYNIKVKDMAASANRIVKNKEDDEPTPQEQPLFSAVEMETAPAAVVIPPRVEVFEGMTQEELAEKLNRNLGNDVVSGKGDIIASECINKGVDPYIATAILLHETGCGSRCSNLARTCYNFGGQKGGPGCNGGSYKQFNSIEEGLSGLIDNLNNNYFSRGLNTVETIGPKYAESDTWVGKINWYVEKIRNS